MRRKWETDDMARTKCTTGQAVAPARLRALATTVFKGLTEDFECNYLGGNIFSVQSINERGGITLAGPRVVDIVAETCTCEGFMHMGRCKHIVAALRRASHCGLVDSSEYDSLYVIKDSGRYRTVEGANQKRAVVCFLNMDDALRVERTEESVICPMDATMLDCGYDGIMVVVGKYIIPCWHEEAA